MRDASPVELERFWASQVAADTSPAHQWECLGPDNVAGRVTALTIHPHNPQVWFAGSATGGVWVTNNSGETWRPTWSKFANQNIGALAWLENRHLENGPLFLFAATGEANMNPDAYPGSGIYQTSDLGLTWQPTFGPLPGKKTSLDHEVRTFPRRVGCMAMRHYRIAVGSVYLDNSLPAGLYLAVIDKSGFQAVEYWGRRSYNCHSVLMHPQDEKTLYASIEPDGAHNGIWRTTDFGNSWVHLTKGLPPSDEMQRISLAFAPSDPDVMYALAAGRRHHVLGIFRSTDAGKSWREIGGGRFPKETQMQYNNVIAVHPRKPDSVIWGGMHLFRTDDAGRNWRRITNQKHVHNDHHALLWPDDDLIISGNDGGVAVSHNGGRTWKNKSKGMVTTMFYGVAVAPSNGKIFAGGTQDNGLLIGGLEGVTSLEPGQMLPAVSGDCAYVAFDGANAEHVFACDTSFAPYRHRPGKPWDFSGWTSIRPRKIAQAEIDLLDFTVMAIEPSTHSGAKTVWAGSTRLWETQNNGQNWEPISPSFDGTSISAIAASRGKRRVLMVGTTKGGIFRSINGGRTWSQSLSSIDIPDRAITDIEFHPRTEGTLVMTVASSGVRNSGVDLHTGGDLPYGHVFRSEDWGDTWTDIDRGTLPNVVYHAAAYETKPPYRLFIGGDAGVWTEMKRVWLNISGNLPNVVVSDLVYHDKDGTLTAATYGRGIWRMTPPRVLRAPVRRLRRDEHLDVAPGLRVDPRVAAPKQLTPASGVVIRDRKRKTVVTVEPVLYAWGYQVELAPPDKNESVAFSSFTPEISFQGFSDGKYRWRVWAVFADGLRSPVSPWRTITYFSQT
jgi:photosystem II stability/assembly factor-like uncharacterized protein